MQPIEFFFRAARRTPNAIAVIAPGRRITFSELAAEVQRVAALLTVRYPEPSARICIGCKNSVEHLIAILAVLAAGKVWVALNPRNGDPELQRSAEFVEPVAMLLDESMAGRISSNGVPVHLLDGAQSQTVFRQARERNDAFTPTYLPLDSPQAIKFTGGTSGIPKGVVQTYRSWNTNIVTQRQAYGFTAQDRYLVSAPLTHGASTYILPILGAGGAFVFPDDMKPEALIHTIAEHAVTTLFAPPTMVTMLVEAARAEALPTPSLRHLIYGGAAMRPNRIQEAQDVFGPVIASTYGQTEASQVISILNAEDLMRPELLASVGRPSLFTEVGIMDPQGRLLPAGEAGEIVVRGDLVMAGYWRMPEQTAATIVDGWLHTGDVGVLDERDYLFLRDRLREVIITGGFNVYPSDVETVLSQHPAVAQCAVVGIPDDRWGEAVHAAVEPRPGMQIDQAALIAFAKQQLGSVKAPKAVHVFPALPMSAVGKILKTAVKTSILGRPPDG